MSPLYPWQNFYVIVGSAAGALTGLQFVVMALIADMPGEPGEAETAAAFATPTIVHFVAVLLLAASLVMPWPTLIPAAIVWGLAGLAGLAYTAHVTYRMRKQTAYQPVFEDWLCHAILPNLAYLALPVASAFLPHHTTAALFSIAAILLVLLAVGIHNAWDNVTYLVSLRRERLQKASPSGQN